MRTRFADVNIYFSSTTHAPTMQIEALLARMSALLSRIATPADFTLASDPHTFNTTLTSWLTDPSFSFPHGSVVGLCCSSLLSLQFQDPDPLGDDGLMVEFRRFLLATSLAHSGWTGEILEEELRVAGHVAGYRLIKRLDRILTPQFLAKFSRESTQVLFLLVLGAVLGVGYSTAMPPSPGGSVEGRSLPGVLPTTAQSGQSPPPPPQRPSPKMRMSMMTEELAQSPTLYLTMKEHLCQMLAHHLIFLGSTLGIRLETGMEQRIIDTAAARWNKMERFVWAEAQGLQQPLSCLGQEDRGMGMGVDIGFREGYAEKEGGWNPPCWGLEEPPPAASPVVALSPTPTLYPILCPEAAEFRPESLGQWEGNPQSYLDMAMEDEPEDYESFSGPGPGPNTGRGGNGIEYNWAREEQRSNTEPLPRRDMEFSDAARREVKRRTIWLVRPFDAGPEKGQVNLHTRLRGERGGNDFRLFV